MLYKDRKNIKEMIINHKGGRTVKDGKDWHRLQTKKLKSLHVAKCFKPVNCDWAHLKRSVNHRWWELKATLSVRSDYLSVLLVLIALMNVSSNAYGDQSLH